MNDKDTTELFIDSLTEHAGLRRLDDLRNEDSRGKQRTGGRAKGDPLSAFDKEDFRQTFIDMRNSMIKRIESVMIQP